MGTRYRALQAAMNDALKPSIQNPDMSQAVARRSSGNYSSPGKETPFHCKRCGGGVVDGYRGLRCKLCVTLFVPVECPSCGAMVAENVEHG